MRDKIIITEDQALDFSQRAFRAVGMSEEDSMTSARMIVDTEMRGVKTHGLARLGPWYVRMLEKGVYNASPNIRTLKETDSAAHLDADGSLGYVAGKRAMDIAMEKAARTGVGMVTVENVGHFGASFNYPLLASKKGMLGFCCTNTPPWMAAPGTADAAIGTNPLSFAAPMDGHPDFLLDMSCTVVAAAKALREGTTNPEGWVIDKNGNPVTDPGAVKMGQTPLLPLGGDPAHGSYKGFGLGITVEILTAMLCGRSCAKCFSGSGHFSNCSFFCAIDIDAFTDRDSYNSKMLEMAGMLESLPDKLPGVDRLYVPGAHGEKIVEECRQNGIPITEETAEDHRALAKEMKITINY